MRTLSHTPFRHVPGERRLLGLQGGPNTHDEADAAVEAAYGTTQGTNVPPTTRIGLVEKDTLAKMKDVSGMSWKRILSLGTMGNRQEAMKGNLEAIMSEGIDLKKKIASQRLGEAYYKGQKGIQNAAEWCRASLKDLLEKKALCGKHVEALTAEQVKLQDRLKEIKDVGGWAYGAERNEIITGLESLKEQMKVTKELEGELVTRIKETPEGRIMEEYKKIIADVRDWLVRHNPAALAEFAQMLSSTINGNTAALDKLIEYTSKLPSAVKDVATRGISQKIRRLAVKDNNMSWKEFSGWLAGGAGAVGLSFLVGPAPALLYSIGAVGRANLGAIEMNRRNGVAAQLYKELYEGEADDRNPDRMEDRIAQLKKAQPGTPVRLFSSGKNLDFGTLGVDGNYMRIIDRAGNRGVIKLDASGIFSIKYARTNTWVRGVLQTCRVLDQQGKPYKGLTEDPRKIYFNDTTNKAPVSPVTTPTQPEQQPTTTIAELSNGSKITKLRKDGAKVFGTVTNGPATAEMELCDVNGTWTGLLTAEEKKKVQAAVAALPVNQP